MTIETLQQYVAETYPHLCSLITVPQYEQIDWIDTTHQTNEQVPVAPIKIHLQQQRIFARLHFLWLFKQGGAASYERFIAGQKEPHLTKEAFDQYVSVIQALSDLEYQQLWIATVTCKSVSANTRAEAALGKEPPFDSVDFLATVMTRAPEVYPAACALTVSEDVQKNFAAMFDTGHFRHMLYAEGGPNMFSKVRQKIKNGQMDKKLLDLWFAYWLIDIAGFRAQTEALGSAYFNHHTDMAVMCLKRHLDELLADPEYLVLYHYLNDRANWLGVPQPSVPGVFSAAPTPSTTSRFIMARIAAMQRLFTPEEKDGLLRGLDALEKQLGQAECQEMMRVLNPLQDTEEPTPTYGPALLAHLQNKIGYERAIVIGLPLYAQALTVYRALRSQGRLDLQLPLNLNGLAASDNIAALIAAAVAKDTGFSVSIDPRNGTATLETIKLEERASVGLQAPPSSAYNVT